MCLCLLHKPYVGGNVTPRKLRELAAQDTVIVPSLLQSKGMEQPTPVCPVIIIKHSQIFYNIHCR